MKTSIAVFNSHKKAIDAIVALKEKDFPLKKVSIIGKAEIVDNKIEVRSNELLIDTPAIAGTILGTVLGLLTGIGLFAIPGFGFLFGAGAIIGTIGGFDLGIIAGGMGTLLLQLGIKNEYAVKYNEYLNDGKFILIVNGTSEEIENAKKIIGHDHINYHVHEHRQLVR